MEQLSVGTGSNFINDGWFKIKEDGSWDMLTSTCLREEGVEGIVTTTNGLITWHLPIWLDAVFQTKELPACITNLDAGLANVDAKCLTHLEKL